MKNKINIISWLLIIILCVNVIQPANAQDQIEIPSWEIGWETDMDGVYELSLQGEDGILDAIEFYVSNDRMGDLTLEITVSWEDSENIPIKLDYQESITVPSSSNETFVIDITDESGYSFERSPTDVLTLLVLAEEVLIEQSVSNQEIEAELSVPSVFELEISSQSNNEVLYPGSSIEYQINVENKGNGKDVIKSPEESIKSCPSLSIEGVEALENIELGKDSNLENFTITILASESHPERTCEITISIKSAGNGKISTTIFDVSVNSQNQKQDSEPDYVEPDSNQTDKKTDVVESNTLYFLSGLEVILIAFLAIMVQTLFVRKYDNF